MWVLFIGWVYSIFLIESTLCDLPSCIRAKCSHCKVPFIAQMCLNACSGCPMMTQNHLTYEKEARTSSGEIAHQRAFHSRIKVPFAQQIPYVDSNNRGPFNPIERNNNIQKLSQQNQQFIIQKKPQTNIFPQVQSGTWQQNGIAPADQKFTQPIPNNQFGTQQSQQFTQYPINFPQQTTNYGGSYGPGEGAFNPFQPFLQQSFQSMQQIQPSVSSQSQPTYSPILQPNTQILQQPKPPQPYIGSQAEQNGQFKLGGQIQQNGQFQNTQQFIQQPIDGQQLQTNQNQPILHAVPNVVDPLQRPRQLHNLPSQLELREKWNEGKTIYPKVIPANEIKKPEIIRNNFSPGSNGKTCPKTNWEPCVPKDIANKRFQNCCSGLGEGCSQLCSYDQNLTTIQLAVLTGRCPVNKVADMMICASGYEDATACCQAFGVFEAGYEHCRPYCNPAGGLPNDGMLAEKYRCLQKLQQIQRCFYLTQRP